MLQLAVGDYELKIVNSLWAYKVREYLRMVHHIFFLSQIQMDKTHFV